jgi:hypothetical protein
MNKSVALLVLAVSLLACGRYIAPIAPELMAPRAVDKLVITPSQQGVAFSWVAPEEDRRGKELTSFSGYRIRRKELNERGDETDESIPFVVVGFVPDTHVEVREKLRAEARSQGKIGRRIQAPAELTEFTFFDKTAAAGKTYLYKIVPENQGVVEGVVDELIKVTFKGNQSDVSVITSRELETPLGETQDKQSEPS